MIINFPLHQLVHERFFPHQAIFELQQYPPQCKLQQGFEYLKKQMKILYKNELFRVTEGPIKRVLVSKYRK